MAGGMMQDIARNQRQGASRLGKIMGVRMGRGSGTPSLFCFVLSVTLSTLFADQFFFSVSRPHDRKWSLITPNCKWYVLAK